MKTIPIAIVDDHTLISKALENMIMENKLLGNKTEKHDPVTWKSQIHLPTEYLAAGPITPLLFSFPLMRFKQSGLQELQ